MPLQIDRHLELWNNIAQVSRRLLTLPRGNQMSFCLWKQKGCKNQWGSYSRRLLASTDSNLKLNALILFVLIMNKQQKYRHNLFATSSECLSRMADEHIFHRCWQSGMEWIARKPDLRRIIPHYVWAVHDTPKTLTKLNNLPNLEKVSQPQLLNIIFSYQRIGWNCDL